MTAAIRLSRIRTSTEVHDMKPNIRFDRLLVAAALAGAAAMSLALAAQAAEAGRGALTP